LKFLDSYTLRARLAPALVAAIPPAVVIACGALSENRAVRALGVFGGVAGLVICGLVRRAGRRIEPDLWQSWGGSPTRRRLRWRDNDHDSVRRIHRRIAAITGDAMPTTEEERTDPDRADARYDAAISSLRARTRDTGKFGVLFQENMEYGFRRNSLGIRPYAFALAVACVIVGGVAVAVRSADWQQWAVSIAVGLAAIAYWIFLVKPGWVREAAETYADRLLETVDVLDQESSSPTNSK
jgi:hypothetical protein